MQERQAELEGAYTEVRDSRRISQGFSVWREQIQERQAELERAYTEVRDLRRISQDFSVWREQMQERQAEREGAYTEVRDREIREGFHRILRLARTNARKTSGA